MRDQSAEAHNAQRTVHNTMNENAKNGKLRHVLERLRTLSDGIDEPIYVVDLKTYEILFANNKTKQLFGGKITGRKCYKVFQNLNSPCPFCNNKHLLGKNHGKTKIREPQDQRNKRWYRCMDKAIKWPGDKYVRFGIAIDITEHKQLEEALRESEELFRSVAENSHNAIAILDDNFRIIYVNNEIEHLSGYSKEEVTGQNFRNFLDKAGLRFKIYTCVGKEEKMRLPTMNLKQLGRTVKKEILRLNPQLYETEMARCAL